MELKLETKSFAQFLLEDLNSVANIATPPDAQVALQRRKNLPQIASWVDFNNDLTKAGYGITQATRDPAALYPTQSEFNEEKVKKMMTEDSSSAKPILISSDDCIVDGHHRWMAALKGGKQVAVSQIQIPYSEVYDFLDNKSYVTKKDLHESETVNPEPGSTIPSEDELAESMKAWSKEHPGVYVHAWKVDGGYQYWKDKGATHGTPNKHFITKADFARKYSIE